MFFNLHSSAGSLQLFKTSPDLQGKKLAEKQKTFSYQLDKDLKMLEFQLRVEKDKEGNKSILVPNNFSKNDKLLQHLVLPLAAKIVEKTKFPFLGEKQEDYLVIVAPHINYSQAGVLTFMATFTNIYILQSGQGTSFHIETLGELSEKDFFSVLSSTDGLQNLVPQFVALAQRHTLLETLPELETSDKNSQFKI